MDSWLRRIHVPRDWCVFISDWIQFSRKKKIVLVLGRSDPDFAVSLPLCHFTVINEGKVNKKVKIDLSSKFSNLSNCKEEA